MRRFLLLITALLIACSGTFSAFGRNVHIKTYCKRGSDVSEVLQTLVNKYETVIIDKGTWFVSKPIYLRSGVTIKGVSQKKSILKLNPQAIIDGNRKFCLFTTATPKALFGEEYTSFPQSAYRTKTFKNIEIKNLTIDVNRRPDFFVAKKVSARIADLNIVRFENCGHCKLTNCIIKDYCTPESFNNNAVVKLIESESCVVENCVTSNCTFIQLMGGQRNVVNANKGENSVGTWIETIGGRGHVISNNYIKNVYDYVSTIGINSVACEVSHNHVDNDNEAEISCLTLGHSQDEKSLPKTGRSSLRTKADSCYVHDNYLKTSGQVSLLVQNGSNIILENNYIASNPEKDNSAPASLYIHGQRDNLHGLRVIQNTIESFGRRGSAFCGDCLDNAIITNNTINTTCRYAIRLGRPTTTVTISDNTINITDGEVVSADEVATLKIINNHFKGGWLNLHYSQLDLSNNKWESISKESRFEVIETTKGLEFTTKVENNQLVPATGVQLQELARTISKTGKSERKEVSGNSFEKSRIKTILF